MTQTPEDLNPNDADVYTNPDKVRLLDPSEQMIATINLAKTGQLVGGDNIRTLEAIMASAGYDMVLDGQLSAEELNALDNFKRKLDDADFKETANELLGAIIGSPEEGKLKLPVLGEMISSFMGNDAQAAPAKKQQLISDPM